MPNTRLLQSTFGAASVAISTFLQSYLLLKYSTVDNFGFFSIYILLQTLCLGVLNALICTPLSKYVLDETDNSIKVESSFFKLTLCICFILSLVLFFIFIYLGISYSDNVFLVLGFSFTFLRWFFRASYNNQQQNKIVFYSDFILFATVIIFVLYGFINKSSASLGLVSISVFISSLIALIIISKEKVIILSSFEFNFSVINESFQRQGKHALLGVLSTELSLSFHAYILTFVYGPIYFAPFAAAYMYFRPLTLFVANFISFKRGYATRLQIAREYNKVYICMRNMFIGVCFFFICNTVAILFILYFSPSLLWANSNSFDEFETILYVVFFIFFARSFKMILGFNFQIKDQFQKLSYMSLLNLLFVIFSVSFTLYMFEPKDTVYAILLAELAGLLLLIVYSKKRFNT